ncbi:MAG TPA: hypothetical protein VF974_00470 [Patescibacteria group bacterium]
MNKRNLIIIGVIILLIIGGVLFYAKKQSQKTNTYTQSPPSIKKILDEAVISPVGAFDNNSIWYFNADGRLFKVNTDGTNISEFPLPPLPNGKLRSVIWPKQGSDFISFAVDGNKFYKDYFDSANKFFINLADNVQWIEWLPDGKRVVYVWQASDKKSQQLVRANADGSGYKIIAPLFWPDLILKASPDGKTILMYRSKIEGDTNKIYATNLDSGAMSTLVDTGKNTGVLWLPVGNMFLYAQNSKIYLFDVLNKLAIDLNLNTALDKITADASGKIFYAAVPKSDKSGDTFIKLNLSNGKSESYFEPTSEVQSKNVMLIGNTIYYTDSRDNKLYMISK